MPNFIALCLLLAAALAPGGAAAQDIALIGVIGDKAVVVAVDGGEPKTIRVGQAWKGILVVSVEKDQAVLDIDGKRRVLQRGAHYRSAATAVPGGRQSVILSPDSRGHFNAEGAINGGHVRFLVDTGATSVTIPAVDATRLGIDYRKGRRINISTANGIAPAYLVTFDRIRVGDIELHGVEGVVAERGLQVALLGMSFLNRVEMKRDGNFMTLIRLF